jgi:cytochrome c-type biogenesis protein CcmH
MTLWIFFAVMLLVAIGFVVIPLYRQQKKLTAVIAVSVVVVVAISAGLYHKNGTPDALAGAGAQAGVDDLLVELAQRLDRNPNDIDGWKILGRSYSTVGNFQGAISAFEHVVELDGGKDAESLVALGESLLAGSGGGIEGRVATLSTGFVLWRDWSVQS